MTAPKKRNHPLSNMITMFFVSGLSLLMLIYVGYGEAQRNYYQFLIDEVTAQGKVVQNAMKSHLRAGLPISQYVGFLPLTKPIIDSDKAITSMIVVDHNSQRLFESGDKTVPILTPIHSESQHSESQHPESGDIVLASDQYYQIVLPLRNKFEEVGDLFITMPRAIVTDRLITPFKTLLYIALALSICFAYFSLIGPGLFVGARMPWLQIGYGMTFISMAVVVIVTLLSLYSEGAQLKTKALGASLGQRLSDLVTFNLNIDQFDGLERTFADYRRLNPDISAAGLAVNGIVQIHTDPNMVGKPWQRPPRSYEYTVDLSSSIKDANKYKVAVAVPSNIVYRHVLRSAKNFTALFIASAFLAGLFLQFAGSVQRGSNDESLQNANSGIFDREHALNLVKPVFFVAVFMEHLNYPFLPQFISQITENSGLTAGFTSAPFMAYYLFFALALIPAGQLCRRYGPRPLIFWGILLAGAGLLGLIISSDFYAVTLTRVASGIGQGILFIGVQSYILANASPGKKTQGNAIIVIGFQGGMISGTAIGSLLVGYLGPSGVFTLSTFLAIALAFYVAVLVPTADHHIKEMEEPGGSFRSIVSDLKQLLRSGEFLSTMLFIGVPAKAVMTGVVVFGLPLLLSMNGYAPEDIGQIIMLYAVGVLVACTYISRYVDRCGRTSAILFWGTTISGVGLALIGLVDWIPVAETTYGPTVLLILGVVILGIAHGFIWAPIITSVADSKISQKIGVASTTATYRFLERIGHIAGPIIIGQLFLMMGQTSFVIAWIGVAIVLLGALSLIHFNPSPAQQVRSAG